MNYGSTYASLDGERVAIGKCLRSLPPGKNLTWFEGLSKQLHLLDLRSEAHSITNFSSDLLAVSLRAVGPCRMNAAECNH